MTVASYLYRGTTGLLEPLAGSLLSLLARGESTNLREERLGRIGLEPVNTWWHAASLGEVAALEPVLNRVTDRYPDQSFVVTTTSRSGRARAHQLWPGRACLAPMDLPRGLERALRTRDPERIIFVETELWPNWLTRAHAGDVPIGIINGRLSDRTWPRYRRLRTLFHPLLRRVRGAAVRTETDAERFVALGVRSDLLRVTGNTKFDGLKAVAPASLPWKEAVVWTAGSVRPGEEVTLLEAFDALRSGDVDLRMVLVPRHPSAWPDLEGRLRARGLRVAIRSRPEAGDRDADVLIVDGQGELTAFYAAADIVFVGGTLVSVGGHNVLEAAITGAPIIVGPHVATVREEVDALVNGGGALGVATTGEMIAAVTDWLARDRRVEAGDQAKQVAESFRGGADRALEWMLECGLFSGGNPHA
jgi:3-deoxy-D-manno-octulosonic-acid transferase